MTALRTTAFVIAYVCVCFSLLAPPFTVEVATQHGFLIIACAAFATIVSIKFPKLVLPLLFVTASCFASWHFAGRVHGSLISSDDHPSFLYRLTQLRDYFPNIPFYNTEWNGGVEAREFFASGILSLFFLFRPVIALFDVPSSYNTIVSLLLFVVVPAAWMAAAIGFHMSRTSTFVVGLFAVLANTLWYRWGLTFGTLGFVTTIAFLPLTLALLSRIMCLSQQTWAYAALIASASLVLFWPLGFVMLLPAGVAVLFQLGERLRDRRFVVMTLVLAGIHLPWMLLFAKASSVFDFLSLTTASEAEKLVHSKAAAKITSESWESTSTRLLEFFRGTHPLIIGFGVLGLFLHPSRLMLSTILWLFILGLLGPFLVPQLELDRLLLVSILLCSFPAARLIAQIFEDRRTTRSWRLVEQFGVIALLLFGIVGLGEILQNRTVVRWYEAQPIVHQLSSAIRTHGGNGRVLFAGFILHELSEGHVAPLVRFTGKPLMASRFQHDRWQYEDIIPESFRLRKDAGVDEFLQLYNVSAIVTHDRFWRRWYKQRPDRYEIVWQGGRFVMFRRKLFDDSYFLSGSGELHSSGTDRIVLTPHSSEITLKFNYIQSLQASECTILPHKIHGSIRFIQLSDCPIGSSVTIQSKTPLQQLFD